MGHCINGRGDADQFIFDSRFRGHFSELLFIDSELVGFSVDNAADDVNSSKYVPDSVRIVSVSAWPAAVVTRSLIETV